MNSFLPYKIITVNNYAYFLVNAGNENYKDEKSMDKYTEVVFIFASNGHIRTYFTDKRIMIVVHTPA